MRKPSSIAYQNQQAGGSIRLLWELLFSLHFGLFGVTASFLANSALIGLGMQMEVHLNRWLEIRQTDFIRGYFETWIPTVSIALLLWLLLRIFRRARFSREFLRSVAGLITILSPPIIWMLYRRVTDVWLPLRKTSWLEVAAVLLCGFCLLSGRWRVRQWLVLFPFAIHFSFWYFFGYGSGPEVPSYLGPAGPILGFCAAGAWVFYIIGSKPPMNSSSVKG